MADTLMWEAAAAPGRIEELLAWIDEVAAPALLGDPGCLHVSSYRAGEDRAVVIAVSRTGVSRIGDPPAELLRRPVHQWPFTRRWAAGEAVRATERGGGGRHVPAGLPSGSGGEGSGDSDRSTKESSR